MQKLVLIFFSSKLTLFALIAFATAMGAATFIENDFGTQTARTVVYNAWWFELLMLVLALNFTGNIFKYRLWRKQKWPILVFHLAFILILVGAAVTRYAGYEGVMRIREGESSNLIISDRNFLQLKYAKGRDTLSFNEELYFSPIRDNDFSLRRDL
jgi:cytochrome c biogenesis factor